MLESILINFFRILANRQNLYKMLHTYACACARTHYIVEFFQCKSWRIGFVFVFLAKSTPCPQLCVTNPIQTLRAASAPSFGGLRSWSTNGVRFRIPGTETPERGIPASSRSVDGIAVHSLNRNEPPPMIGKRGLSVMSQSTFKTHLNAWEKK